MSEIKLTADSGGGTTSLKAPSSTTSNADVVLKLPVADGSANQVLKTDGSGQLSFTSNAGTTINNNADNRVITGSGTANTLNGEANLTFSSSLLVSDGNGSVNVGGNYALLKRTSGTTNYIAAPNADAVLDISADETIRFGTVNTGDFNSTERMRIDSSGRVGIKNTSMSSFNDGMDDLVIGNGVNGTSPGMTIYSNSSDIGTISFTDDASTGITGLIQYRHNESPPYMRIMVEGTQRASFTTHGGIAFNSDTAAANTLDDYEEGTWTPTSNVGAISVHNASYIKIGNLITYRAYISFPSMSGVSNVEIQGFPFQIWGSDYHTCPVNSDANLGDNLVGQYYENTGSTDFMNFAKSNNVKATVTEMSGHFIIFVLSVIATT